MASPKFLLLSTLLSSALAFPTALRRDTAYAGYNDQPSVTSRAGLSSLVSDLSAGPSQPSSSYQCYHGIPSEYPPVSSWLSFDALYALYQPQILSANGGDTSIEQDIHSAIESVSAASNVNARLILAIIMEESSGVAAAPCTGFMPNCGIMQASYNSKSFSPSSPESSILQMIQQGVQGTTSGGPYGAGGPGLVQYLDNNLSWVTNPYPGNPYAAARAYNSGTIEANLDDGGFGVARYANDIANRLIGWNGVSGGDYESCGW